MSWIYGTPSYCWYARHEHCLMGESPTDHYSTTKKLPESLREVVMIVLTSWKEAHSTYCLIMAQYCPLLGQLFAIARHKMMRREKNFGRSTIAIRNILSGCCKRGFAREKPYSQFYPSPFTFSPETPINTGVVRGEGCRWPFTHPSPTLHLIKKSSQHWRQKLAIIDG